MSDNSKYLMFALAAFGIWYVSKNMVNPQDLRKVSSSEASNHRPGIYNRTSFDMSEPFANPWMDRGIAHSRYV